MTENIECPQYKQNNGRQQAADFASKICIRIGQGDENMTPNISGGNKRNAFCKER